MSFFRKLRDRLGKSSSKIDEGLEEIVAAAPVSEEPTQTVETPVSPEETGDAPQAPVVQPAEVPQEKQSLIARVLGRGEEKRRVLDDAMLESLEELLITADMGVETALRVTANMAEGRFGRKLGVEEIKS
ncbi:MAG TPA: signal recognition particle receptor subunit alpha, partial [Paracoccaceae bacterium]|nr:signal recognition particle receptor subunit alpha [Paracoccaceae bacterium]